MKNLDVGYNSFPGANAIAGESGAEKTFSATAAGRGRDARKDLRSPTTHREDPSYKSLKVMSRRASILWAGATTAIFVIFALNSAQVSGWQLSEPRILDARGPITYFIADGSGRTGYHSGDRELARGALEAWQRSTAKALQFGAAPESSALIRLYWAEPSEGNYGEMRPLTVGGRLGAAVYIRPDMEALGPEIAQLAREDMLLRDSIVYLTCLHEFGHALGLVHTSDFRDIMYYFGYGGDIAEYFGRYRKQIHSRNDIASVSGLSDADVRRIRALYNRE